MPNRYFRNEFSDNNTNVINYSYYVIWRNKAISLTKWIMKNASSSSSNDLYTGTTGIAYMFYRLATSNTYDTRLSTSYLNKAVEVLKLKEYKFNEKKSSQFICGDAGINAVYAAIYHQIGDYKTSEIYLENFKKGLTICKPIDFHMAGGDELFVGRAGYLYGVLWLEKVFAKKIISDQDIVELCSTIVESGRRYSRQKKSMFPLMYSYYNKEYLGAAHGLCTILQVLISFPQFIDKEPQAKQDIKTCIDMLISLQMANGNFPCTMSEIGPKQRPEQDELVHWCHGAPGVVYLLAKAYLVFNERSYLECCLKCGDLVWNKGLLKKGPGLCHGVAGNGYVFLLLYRLTHEVKHLNRAMKFAEFVFIEECIQRSRTPDHPYSLYEGFAGTVCFLEDLVSPENANFPFLDVF